MRVSIIIPTKGNNPLLTKCLSAIQNITYRNFETIVVSEKDIDLSFSNAKLIIVDCKSPSSKRNIGARVASGEVLAFIDDDAYPRKDWLSNVVDLIKVNDVSAVCGPAITAPVEHVLQAASADVIESPLVSAGLMYRYSRRSARFVDDFPSCNLFVKKEMFIRVGGFEPGLFPGEDTKLCLEIVHCYGGRILYHPDVIVFHHRRALFRPYLDQISKYARMRGHFSKVYPKTSRRLHFFIPSVALLLYLLVAAFAISHEAIRALFIILNLAYLSTLLLIEIPRGKRSSTFLVLFGIILTHISYASFFLYGYLSS